jgi:hypothetical protein
MTAKSPEKLNDFNGLQRRFRHKTPPATIWHVLNRQKT